MEQQRIVLDRDEIDRALTRMAHEVLEAGGAVGDLRIVGIQRRGAVLAARLAARIEAISGTAVPLGLLDIGFYRDDLGTRPDAPQVHATEIGFEVQGATVVIVDDGLYTGRTVRAAIDAIFGYGRPDRIQLAVLADRGHRELPIRPDFVGKNLPTSETERVFVRVEEVDGTEQVEIGESARRAA